MRQVLAKALRKDFPLTFLSDPNGRDPWSMFGFEVGDGWEPSIRKTAEKLEPIIAELIVSCVLPKGCIKIGAKILPNFILAFISRRQGFFPTAQLKEKFGTGRWYMNGNDEMDRLVSIWEDQTESICEHCGQPGKLRGKSWWYTSCATHAKKTDLDNLEMLEAKSLNKEQENG